MLSQRKKNTLRIEQLLILTKKQAQKKDPTKQKLQEY